MGPGELIAILAGIGCGTVALMTPVWIIKNILAHREKMARIKQGIEGGVNGLTPEEVDSLRRELAVLRETTTRFDMSFDAALSRVEERLDSLETQQAAQNEDAIAAQRGVGYDLPLATERREYGKNSLEEAPAVSLGRR
ncbi:MAG: hypothetical protein WCP07_06435 [bacterium]